MDPIWIIVAFVLGFAVKQIGLPPLVGFLLAGFALNIFGVEGGETLDRFADFGVYLLLFSIGLKLKIKSLFQPVIWGTASLHMLIIVVIFGLGIFGLSMLSLSLFDGLSIGASLLIAFALSFFKHRFCSKNIGGKRLNVFHAWTHRYRYTGNARYICRDFPYRFFRKDSLTMVFCSAFLTDYTIFTQKITFILDYQ